jgi:predicted DNA-binding helix-hairpin-helix protein
VDVNRAPRELLLRVPGLGVRNVDRLLQVRRWHRVTLADLTRLRVPLKKTMPFIVVADHTPHLLERRAAVAVAPPPKQLDLFAPAPASAITGEL